MATNSQKHCFSSFSTKHFNAIEKAALEEAAVAGRKSPINADYIKAVTKLLAMTQDQITGAKSYLNVAEQAATEQVAKQEAPATKVEDSEKVEPMVETPEHVVRANELIAAIESAKTEEEYTAAMDAFVKEWNEYEGESAPLEAYLDENMNDKAFVREFNEAETRYNAKAEKPADLKFGRSKKGTASKLSPETIQGISSAFAADRFSQATNEVPQENWLPLSLFDRAIASIRKTLEKFPDVIIADSPASVGINPPAGVQPAGVVHEGKIYLFRSGIGNFGTIYTTLFHELFHYGLHRVVSPEEYSQRMRELEKADPKVAEYANAWRNSVEGQQRKTEMNSAMWDALAVEEALADIAEDGPSNVSNTGMYKNKFVTRMLDLLAKVAEVFGLEKAANALRKMTFSEGELFVRSVIKTFQTETSAPVAAKPDTFSAPRTPAQQAKYERESGIPPELSKKFARTKLGLLLRNIWAGWRGSPWALGMLTLDQIKDRFGADFKNVSHAIDKWLYMGQRANQLMEVPSELRQKWAALTRHNPQMTRVMEKLFVDATLNKVWVDGKMEPRLDPRNAHLDFKDPAVAQKAAEIRTAYMSLSQEHRDLYSSVTGELQKQFRAKQEAILKHVVDMFEGDLKNVLSREEMLDFAQNAKVERELTRLTMNKGLTTRQRIDLQKFNAAVSSTYIPSAEVPGPYFPLQRKGTHVVVFKSAEFKDLEAKLDAARENLNSLMEQEVPAEEDQAQALFDEIEKARRSTREARNKLDAAKAQPADYKVSFFNSLVEAQDFQTDEKLAGRDTKVIVRQEFQNRSDAVPASFLNKLTAQLSKDLPEGIAKDVSATVRDMVIKSMPDFNSFKSELSRMNVDGVKPEDTLQSFATASHRNAWMVSRMENVSDLTKALTDAHGSEDMDERIVGNELMKRYNNSLSYTPKNALLDAAANMSYMTHLGFSVGYYFQNMLQPWMVSAPVMAGKFGINRTAKELSKATTDVARAMKQTISLKDAVDTIDMRLKLDSFTPEEQRLIQQLTDNGRINITVRADLGTSQSDATNKVSHYLQRASEISAWPAHQVEVVNRVATALAAFRMHMADSAKPDYKEAMAYADKVVVQTHVDYSVENAPRFMNPNAMGGLGRLAFQFRRYQQAMVFLWGKTLRDAIKEGGWNEHTKALTYLTGVNFAMAGAAGLPIAAPLGLLAAGIARATDDDGEKTDYLQMLNAGIRDVLGEDFTNFVTKGAPAALGIDMSARLGSGSILAPTFRMPQGNTGEALMGSAALTLFGPTGGMLANWADAVMVKDSNPELAVQKVLPKGLGQFQMAVAREYNGLRDRRGNATIDKDELGVVDFLGKALSFGESTKVTNMYDSRNAIKESEEARHDYRAKLLSTAASARREGDSDAAVKAREKIADFNDRFPAVAIKPKDVIAYYKQEDKRHKEMVGGIRINKRNADLAEEYGVTR